MHQPDLHAADLERLATWPAPEAVERLTRMLEALPRCDDPAALEALARALPDTVAGLAPEVALALQALALALVDHAPTIPRDIAALEPRLRLEWRRVQLAVDDPPARSLDEQELLQVVHAWSLDGVLDPTPLLRRLTAAADERLRSRGLAWIEPAVRQLAITREQAFALLVPLAADPSPTLRARALTLACGGWLCGLGPAAVQARERLVLAGLVDPDPAVVQAAITAAAALARRDWLLALLTGEAPDSSAADALDALGPLAREVDIELALALAARDPLRFGPPLRRFLLAAHRHGVFVREQHLGDLLAAFDAHPPWTGEELVRVTYIVRAELLDRLATHAADEPRWIRRAPILAASFGTRAHAMLRDLLVQVHDPAIAEALIEAAGCSAEYSDEAPLLAWLDRLPETVLPVLRVKGGAQAEPRLRAYVEDLRHGAALRARAMDVLWALARDRGAVLTDLSARLGPHATGLLAGTRLVHRDRLVARIVADAPWGDDQDHTIDPTRQLEILCESGDLEHLPRITELFRELFRGLVRRALAGDFTIKRIEIPALEQRLFRYGRHLLREGRSVRRWIEPGPETGRDLLLRIAIDWLREQPADAVCVALLELIGRHTPGAAVLRFIEPFWRHGDREVRRAAIEAILAAGEDARGLELSICRLAGQDDPRILVQALTAVAVLRAQWAEPIVIAALQRPEMAVKKEAAHALAEVGTQRSIATLVGWLAHHDNRGLRDELLAALERAAGPTLVAVLIAALDDEHEPRRVELLWSALAGRLPLAAALRLARSDRPAHRDLLTACLDGRVTLADASADILAAKLHRARLLPQPAIKDPGRDLRLAGFSPAAARALVDQRAPGLEAKIVATVRAGLGEWIAWLRADADADARALALVLDATQAQHGEHVPALLECVARHLAAVDAAAVAGFLERCVAGRGVARRHELTAIGLLRALPASASLGGLRRYRLLASLGALRTPADLARCLDASRLGPDHAHDSAALLRDALAIPAFTDDEPAELTALRKQAERWHALPEPRATAWLADTLSLRPLDVPVLAPLAAAPRPRFEPHSPGDLEQLCTTLREGDEQERSRAAARLLDWPDAAPAWPQVLAALLQARVTLTRDHHARLAPLLTHWPADPAAQRAALLLLPRCRPRQRREFLHTWVDRWRAGDPTAAELLRDVSEDDLLPIVWSAAERGDYQLARLLHPTRSAAMRGFIARFAARSPADVEHLLAIPATTAPADDTTDPADPIEGRAPDELLALLARKDVARGLAVRAVHALASHGEPSVAALTELAVDPRAQVRSAALRALRQVAPREQSLAATAMVLAMETRTDIILQLMNSLAHGRHEPALPALLEHLHHREPRIRQGAHDALRAWGSELVPTLRRASHRARPDRRPAYAALIAELAPEDS